MGNKNRIITLGLSATACSDPTRQRLEEAFDCLEEIRILREEGENAQYARRVEERIVWRELLDLELQDVDERIERISAAAGRAA